MKTGAAHTPEERAVLSHLRAEPTLNTCREIAQYAELATWAVRGALRTLRAGGKVRSEGRTQGTRWFRT